MDPRTDLWSTPEYKGPAPWLLFPPVFAATCGLAWYTYFFPALCAVSLSRHPEFENCGFQGAYSFGSFIVTGLVSLLVALICCVWLLYSSRRVLAVAALAGAATTYLQALAFEHGTRFPVIVLLVGTVVIGSAMALVLIAAVNRVIR